MSGELLLILIVSLLVFSPKKIPMLASHLGLFFKQILVWKEQASLLWEQQLKELQLQNNLRKAEDADRRYKAADKRDIGN